MSSARVVKPIKYPIENAFIQKLTKQNTTESSADSFLSRPSRGLTKLKNLIHVIQVISSSQSSVCSDDFPCLAEEISSFKDETSSIEAGRVNNNNYIQMEGSPAFPLQPTNNNGKGLFLDFNFPKNHGIIYDPEKAQESVSFESETGRQTTNINNFQDITPRR